MAKRYTSFAEVWNSAKKSDPLPLSVVAAHDVDVLTAVHLALQSDAILPYLIGDAYSIEQLAERIGIDRDRVVVIPSHSDEESAYIAAEFAERGVVRCVMKGMLNSSVFLKGILNRDFHLRTGRLLSHLSIFEIPGFSRLLFLTDGGLNIHPNLEEKDAILMNSIDFIRDLGIEIPKVALLAANEQINEKMSVTVDTHQLSSRGRQGHFGPAIVEGPLSLDLALSKEAVEHKGIQSEINGEADLLFVPTIEVGNVLGKAITYFGNGVMAGLVLGAKVPLILTSRTDSYSAKLASIGFAMLASSHFLTMERS